MTSAKRKTVAYEMRELLGLSNTEIAKRLNCSPDTVQDSRVRLESGYVPPSPSWSDERVETLKKLWAEGHSASLVALRLGGFDHCTDKGRSAVIGKVHRLKLTRSSHGSPFARTKPSIRRILQAAQKRAKVAPPPAPISPLRALNLHTFPLPDPAETDIPRITFADLENHHCRWICVKDPKEVPHGAPLYCGAEKLPGISYCAAHARRAYDLHTPRKAITEARRVLETA